jgi:[ribosomal protein S5]-alanine N-acetyltransferase
METPDHVDLTEDVYLSRHQRTDVRELVNNLSNPAISKNLVLPPFPYTPVDAQEWHDFLDEEKVSNPQTSRFRYVIRLRSGLLVGDISLSSETEFGHYKVGYWLAESSWGQGIMTKALAALLDIASETRQVSRISAHVKIGNIGSVRVLEKNGFQRDTTPGLDGNGGTVWKFWLELQIPIQRDGIRENSDDSGNQLCIRGSSR